MRIIYFFITGMLLSVINCTGQNLLGYHVNDIRKTMMRIRPEFTADETNLESKNPSIKYSDAEEDNTLVFYLDEKGRCKYEKFLIEISLAEYVVDTLSRKYKYLDNLTWEDKHRKSIIEMENSEWFFTILITRKES